MDFDLSTINTETLAELPALELPPSYHLQTTYPGNGCFGDAPGYPTYFTRNVYTRHDNTPHRGPTQELRGHVTDTADRPGSNAALMRRLYVPLPYDHPRVTAWERMLYTHMAHCYTDIAGVFPLEYGKPAMVIYPVPNYKLRTFRDDARFSDEWRTTARAAVEQTNAEIAALTLSVALPENHNAVRAVRTIYPDATIRHEWIAKPPGNIGNWWERHAERPTPEQCPGDRAVSLDHNAKGWCQFCGYTAGR